MEAKELLAKLEEKLEQCESRCDGPHLVVLDKGFVFHGNLVPPAKPGDTYLLTNCVNVRRWSKGGFGGLSLGAKTAEAVLDASANLAFKERAMIFACPTPGDWRTR